MTADPVQPRRSLDEVLRLFRSRRVAKQPSILDWRAEFAGLAASFRLPPGVAVHPVDAAGVPAEWVVPEGVSDSRAILYLHGGGYCFGSPATHRHLVAHLAQAAGARILSLDYRLAPENPFPAAIDDARAAWRWLGDTGWSAGQLALAGDSAGGGLAAALLARLLAEGQPLPVAAVLLSPWLDLSPRDWGDGTRAAADPLLHPLLLELASRAYLADGDPYHPWASPVAAEPRGWPPLLIQVGEREILLGDAQRLAQRAAAAGVDVTLDQWAGMVHVWHFFASVLPEGREALAQAGRFLAGHWPDANPT